MRWGYVLIGAGFLLCACGNDDFTAATGAGGASGSAFILHLLGNDDVAVFDGAWEAWAAAARATR